VLLSVVLDTGKERSFVLVLDAASLNQLARAAAPHAIPFHFHGNYFPEASLAGLTWPRRWPTFRPKFKAAPFEEPPP
jgi:beta,beta-carotene 9',10'-dioxygenase